MSWTSRKESDEHCKGALGRVASEECVARIIIKQEPDQGYNPFPRADLLPPKNRETSNACGNQDGLSVDRCSSLSEEQIYARSAARAELKNRLRQERGKLPNQKPLGASIARVHDLRSISRPATGGQQIVFVYDDALMGNDEHAVIRISTSVPEEEVSIVLDDLKKVFNQEVGAPRR